MADPRVITDVQQRRAPRLSPLMQEKANNLDGGVVNFCPYGCEDHDLDQSGYCDHLVGFSNDKQTFEPMVFDERLQRRVVRVRTEKVGTADVPVLEKLKKGDKFVQITTSYRVYRNVKIDRPAFEPPAEDDAAE